MDISLDQAVEIYAKLTVGWFGSGARSRTEDRIDALMAASDDEGAEAFGRVLQEVERIERENASV